MGTTLTGTTPQDTYDSLIKVTDNGPISGTAKFLSDGLGNDSALALSTTLVGIGTATPSQLFQVQKNSAAVYSATTPTFNTIEHIRNATSGTGANSILNFTSEPNGEWYIGCVSKANFADFVFASRDAAYGERMRITSAGNVGIGTSSPIEKTTINGLVAVNGASATSYYVGNNSSAFVDFATNQTRIGAQVSSGASSIAFLTASAGYTTIAERVRVTDAGLTFNGDTAAANALDDYEEGTFTPTLASGFSSAPSGYSQQSGKYTKIGDVVYYLIDIDPNGAVADASAVEIGGLPFTASASSPAGGGYITYQTGFNTNASDSLHIGTSGTTILFADTTGSGRAGNAAGVNINSRVIISGFYKV